MPGGVLMCMLHEKNAAQSRGAMPMQTHEWRREAARAAALYRSGH